MQKNQTTSWQKMCLKMQSSLSCLLSGLLWWLAFWLALVACAGLGPSTARCWLLRRSSAALVAPSDDDRRMDDGQALGQAILRVSPLFRLTISSGHRPLRQCVRRSPLLSSPLSSPFSLSLSLFCQLPNSRLVTKVDTQQCPSSSSSWRTRTRPLPCSSSS